MAGAVNIAEVMFPGGSPELVEPIYKNPKLSAPFNEQLADVICAYVRHRLPSLAPGEKVLLRLKMRVSGCTITVFSGRIWYSSIRGYRNSCEDLDLLLAWVLQAARCRCAS